MAARDTANALKNLSASVRGVAATSKDRELQDKILEHSRDVMDKSASLIEEAKKAVNNPNNPDNQTRLTMVKHYFLSDSFRFRISVIQRNIAKFQIH